MRTGGKLRASRQNRVGMAAIAMVVLALIAVLLYQSRILNDKINQYQTSNARLEERIREEEDRTKELGLLPDYVSSDEYIEQAAREKFGLVYADEIVFKPEE